MSELCHICDLFRTALFGPTNATEDHLDDGQGNDLPEPMADQDAPATMRTRARPASQSHAQHSAAAKSGVDTLQGDTAPSTTVQKTSDSEVAAAPPPSQPTESSSGEPVIGATASKPAPKTKFRKGPTRGLKSAPAYMSFDDVEVEDDDSDGELFIDETHGRGAAQHHARSPGSYVVPSVYRAPDIPQDKLSKSGDGVEQEDGADTGTPAAPAADAPPAPAYSASKDTSARGADGVGGQMHGSDVLGATRGGTGYDVPTDHISEVTGRPHAQSITESFHGYKGYPGYEPNTPVSAQTANQTVPSTGSSGSLTINAPADVVDRRAHQPEPTPSSPVTGRRVRQQGTSARQSNRHMVPPEGATTEPGVSPANTMDMGSVPGADHHHAAPGITNSYTSRTATSYRLSPAGSVASGYRRGESARSIPAMPSEDGMGSVLGTIAGAEEGANEDYQWKRSALKKFHKVMVKGEGLRVVKHNRAGGTQVRIIRYDPDIKALVWNSKRYMKKAGSANIPIVDIKRVGREGNTVSVTAAGRGTVGFEPQRIRDAKILAEALRALVDKEERSAMWRG